MSRKLKQIDVTMKHYTLLLISIISIAFFEYSCASAQTQQQVVVGAARTDSYLPMLREKRVGIVANQTSMVGNKHIVDLLIENSVNLLKIFSPEHGFRAMADAGATVNNSIDESTGLPIISLYGSHRKPTAEDLSGLDVVIFDIQDVGVRFYTYTSTLHYVMEACAENNIQCIVFDRPNPNGFYIDGNILDMSYSSFVGMHPVPVVHGMTIGEYAKMINGERWLSSGIECDLTVIPCENYNHDTLYELPIRPSPNLPNVTAIYLYPSLCWFEGTNISVGRGTDTPFQVYGSPMLPKTDFSFTPQSTQGATAPMFKGEECYGYNLSNALQMGIVPQNKINLSWVIRAYNDYPDKKSYFTNYFDTLAGGTTLRKQIEAGLSEDEIRESWQEGLAEYSAMRTKYLLYK